MTREDAKRHAELQDRERTCLDNAAEAISIGSSVGAREWMEAAEVARRLAQTIYTGPAARA